MKTEVELTYNSKNISESINKYLISLSYTDYAHGKKDNLQINLENTSGLWTGPWLPSKGAKLELKIKVDKNVFDTGTFEIDDLTYSEPPSVFVMKALSSVTSQTKSVSNTNGLNTRQKRTYENITFGQVVKDIANYHGLSHVYSVTNDPSIERLVQDESDLIILKEYCEKYGFKLKLHSGKIVVYEGKLHEEKPPILVIKRGVSNIESVSFNSKAHEVYSTVKLLYQNIDNKSPEKFIWTPPGANLAGEVLCLDKGQMTAEEAELLAKNELRKKNESGDTGTIKLLGNPLIRAGINVEIEGYSNFDGKYVVEEAKHDVGFGYSVTIKIKKVLGY